MKSSALLSFLAASQAAYAFPGMEKTLREIQARDQDSNDATDVVDSRELIGDLNSVQDAQLSAVGKSVKQILLGGESGQSSDAYNDGDDGDDGLPGKDNSKCSSDTCCIWRHISKDMASKFRGDSGRCNSLARQAVRAGFHDAAGFSKKNGPGGGADGSLVLAAEEMTRPANRGIEDIVSQHKQWYAQYSKYGVGMADLLQMAANVATVVCPLGPRVRTFVGRKDSSTPAPDGLIPSPFDNANNLIALFDDKTISANGLVALLGAHTTSQQRFVDPKRAGDPQDSTPGTWDVLYYSQVLDPNPPKRVFKFPSDISLSQDSRTAGEFKAFAGKDGQQHWDEDYAREYVRMSLLGVQNINDLTECTKVLPRATTSFDAADKGLVDTWTKTSQMVDSVAEAVMNASLLDPLSSIINGLTTGRSVNCTSSAKARKAKYI